MDQKTNTGGRPPKFREPSRPVTVTLPESTLKKLECIHSDRGRAIVKAVLAAAGHGEDARPPVEVIETNSGKGLIVVGPSRALRRIPFLHLVEVSPARYVLALDSGNDFKTLELAISDVLDDVPAEDADERLLLQDLLARIRKLRKSDRVTMAEILFVHIG